MSECFEEEANLRVNLRLGVEAPGEAADHRSDLSRRRVGAKAKSKAPSPSLNIRVS
jgi:hypothetical protein